MYQRISEFLHILGYQCRSPREPFLVLRSVSNLSQAAPLQVLV